MLTVVLALSLTTPSQTGDAGNPVPRKSPSAPSSSFTQDTSAPIDPILAWNALALEAIRKAESPPPLAARNLAILHGALFDTVNTLNPTYQTYRVGLVAKESINLDAALASCGWKVLTDLYPNQAATFDRELQSTLARIESSRPRSLGVDLGKYVANRFLEWRRGDVSEASPELGSGDAEDSLVAGVWRATPPRFQKPLLPNLGNLPCFGLRDRKAMKFVAPPGLDSEEMRRDLEEVRLVGGIDSKQRSADQSITAWFWNDAAGTCTPPGHWNQIARVATEGKNLTVLQNARVFALLNMALADAGILCWEWKYRYRLWRPITAIRQVDSDWSSLLETPPFPSYTSGHSTFSGAAATILTQLLGKEGVEFAIGSDGYPGMERSFKTFWEAAEEAGKSRIYGGIHFACDNRAGLNLGKEIADSVMRSRLLPLVQDPTRPDRATSGDIPAPRRIPRGPEN